MISLRTIPVVDVITILYTLSNPVKGVSYKGKKNSSFSIFTSLTTYMCPYIAYTQKYTYKGHLTSYKI